MGIEMIALVAVGGLILTSFALSIAVVVIARRPVQMQHTQPTVQYTERPQEQAEQQEDPSVRPLFGMPGGLSTEAQETGQAILDAKTAGQEYTGEEWLNSESG